MAKLKLGTIADDEAVKPSVELPAHVHCDLVAYPEVLAHETGQSISDPSKLVAPCWLGSWLLIGPLRKRVGRVSLRRAKDRVRPETGKYGILKPMVLQRRASMTEEIEYPGLD